MLTKEQLNALEVMVDNDGLSMVLDGLARLCLEASERTIGTDKLESKVWNAAAGYIARCSTECKRHGL